MYVPELLVCGDGNWPCVPELLVCGDGNWTYVPELLLCGDGNWSYSVRTDTSIRFGGIGLGRVRLSGTERPVPRGFSCELE
jgi:hypothetical protein